MSDTENQALIDVVKNLHQPTRIDVAAPGSSESVPAFIVPTGEGLEIKSVKPLIDEWRQRPERRQGTAHFLELASLIAHANRFKDAHSALFCSTEPAKPSIQSVLDYHEQGEGQPRFGRHRGVYHFQIDPAWKAWTDINGKPLGQSDFAGFLEDRTLDLIAPPDFVHAEFDQDSPDLRIKEIADRLGGDFAGPARMMQLSRGLAISADVKAQEIVNLPSGEAQIMYDETHRDGSGAPIKVPSLFLIGLPVFRQGAHYRLIVRLRYRLKDGRVTWWLQLYEPDRVFEDAIRGAADQAQREIALPLFFGSPE